MSWKGFKDDLDISWPVYLAALLIVALCTPPIILLWRWALS